MLHMQSTLSACTICTMLGLRAKVTPTRPSLQLRLRPQSQCRPRLAAQRHVVKASFASDAGEDPYKVLGVPKNADSNAIMRAYRKKLAEVKGNADAQQRIEAAHTSIMMSALSMRAQGNVKVDRSIAYADKARYFPWRPRLWFAPRNLMLYQAAAQGLMLAWALLTPSTAGTQPVIWSAVAGAVVNVMKQNVINPPPVRGQEMSDEEKKQGGKNILRGAFLAFLATFAGCAALYTIPDALAAQMGRVMPLWFYEGQSMLLAIGSCIFNWVFTAVYR